MNLDYLCHKIKVSDRVADNTLPYPICYLGLGLFLDQLQVFQTLVFIFPFRACSKKTAG